VLLEVCGWRGCTRLRRPVSAIQFDLGALDNVPVKDTEEGRDFLRRITAQFLFELCGCCYQCAHETVSEAEAPLVLTRGGRKRGAHA
jgi:hypothetical protein